MKRTKSIITAILFFSFITFNFSQNLGSFLKYEGVELLADLAHPSSTYEGGSYKIYDDGVIVDIHYADGYRTKVALYTNNGWFTDIKVISDNDWVRPFFGIELLKDVLYNMLKDGDAEQSSKIQSAYENWFDKSIYDFSGKNITLVAMTYNWANYR